MENEYEVLSSNPSPSKEITKEDLEKLGEVFHVLVGKQKKKK